MQEALPLCEPPCCDMGAQHEHSIEAASGLCVVLRSEHALLVQVRHACFIAGLAVPAFVINGCQEAACLLQACAELPDPSKLAGRVATTDVVVAP